jgi:hypothetical protein
VAGLLLAVEFSARSPYLDARREHLAAIFPFPINE